MSFFFLGVVGMFICLSFKFIMAPSCVPHMCEIPHCPHCFELYTLGSLLKHVKSAHPLATLISQVI
jgi:hypothetical protein